MLRAALAIGVATACLLPPVVDAQQNYYRPLHLQDMVKAVGTNTEGMPPEELPKRITTYALHISDGDGVGVSARFAEDPNGAIIVGWRSGGRLWIYAWVEEQGLGVLETFRPVDTHFVVETRHADKRVTSVLLDADLATVAVLNGQVRTVTPGASPEAPLAVITRTGETETPLTCRITTTPRRICG
jgi:hypothetical protein